MFCPISLKPCPVGLSFSHTLKHTFTSVMSGLCTCVCVCVLGCWGYHYSLHSMAICLGLTKASFSWATVGRWLVGLWNIWITWLAASPPVPPISTQWQTGAQTEKTHTDRDIRAVQKLLPLVNNSPEFVSAPVMHAILLYGPGICLYVYGGVMVGVTVVNRSVCLLGSLFCAHWFTSSSLHSSVFPPVSLSQILNKDRKSGHGGTLEFQGCQVLWFALGSDTPII